MAFTDSVIHDDGTIVDKAIAQVRNARLVKTPHRFGEDGLWLITPELAKKWLVTQQRNRPISARHLARLMAAMQAGRWVANGSPIRFDCEGHLIDGQHRLTAGRDSYTTFQSYVVFGLPLEAQAHIDIESKPRSPGEVFGLLDEANANQLAAAVLWVWHYLARKMPSYVARDAPSIPMRHDLLQVHPGLRDAIVYGRMAQHLLPKSLGTALFYLMQRTDVPLAMAFFETLSHGENLTKGMPVYVLRNRLIANSQSKSKLPPQYLAALTIKTWNRFILNRPMHILQWKGDGAEDFPSII